MYYMDLSSFLSFPQGYMRSPELEGLIAGSGAGFSFANTYFPGSDPVQQLPVVDPADVIEINSGPYLFFSRELGILYDYGTASLVSITSLEGANELPSKHESQGKLLRQRTDGELLQVIQSGRSLP